jgi:hypothetical protein
MSYTGLNYDKQAYENALKESKGVGNYALQTPFVKTQCLPPASSAFAQQYGASIDRTQPMIDIDSELMGLNRYHTKVWDEKYVPCCDPKLCDSESGYPCGQGVVDSCNLPGLRPGSRPQDKNLTHYPDCQPFTDYTRLSQPVCTMRGLGINRWEWLCSDPQERVLIPFDHNINNRIIVKDNHRPLIPTPLDQTAALPVKSSDLPCNKIHVPVVNPTGPVSINWNTPKPEQKAAKCQVPKPCGAFTAPVSVHWQTAYNKKHY